MVTLAEAVEAIEAKILHGEGALSQEILCVTGCDLMSDVLAFSTAGSLLLTGLTNPQSIRTAELAGIVSVCFVRGKRPEEGALRLAREHAMPVLCTELSLFEACGRLYALGLRGFEGEQARRLEDLP